jgi:drug/metabolite transporter (DMT)-like permease
VCVLTRGDHEVELVSMFGTEFQAGVSLACAVVAAAGNAVGNVLQRKASLEQPPGRSFSPGLVWDLVRRPTWLAGFGGMVVSFALQAVALALGELSAVEPVITLEVPMTLLVAAYVFGAPVGRTEWAGIWTMTAGMILLVATLAPRPGREAHVAPWIYGLAVAATVACVVILLLAGRHGRRPWGTACLGAAAGASFGLTATFVKHLVDHLHGRGLSTLLTIWPTYAAVAVGITGVIIMQAALHQGPLVAAQPGITLADPLVSVFWGVLVYREAVRTGLWLLPAALAAVAIGAGVTMLARSPLLAQVADDDPDRSRATDVPEHGCPQG